MGRREPKQPTRKGIMSKYDPRMRDPLTAKTKAQPSMVTISEWWFGQKPDPLARGLEVIATVLGELPDADAPETLGWRYWIWNPIKERLMSPAQGTIWEDPEMRADDWSDAAAVRGEAGVHARRVPLNWERASGPEVPAARDWGECPSFWIVFSGGKSSQPATTEYRAPIITGIVERFGRFVQGSVGWRAEWVIIRKLCAPSAALAAALERNYPDVEIVHGYR